MTYYKVKKTSDQKWRYILDKRSGKKKRDSIFVANELYTPAEIKRFVNFEDHTELVQIKKTNTYWCFGARFECC